jgi:hypothetical protein
VSITLRRAFNLPVLLLVLAATLVLTPVPAAASGATRASAAAAAAAPDFQMVVVGDPGSNPPFRNVKRGSGAPYFVSVNPVNGFTGTVSLSLTGDIPPTGVVTVSNPTGFGPLHDGGVTIQTRKGSSSIGTFTMTIHGTSGAIEHTQVIVMKNR